jgi:hypothetical protein
VVAAPRVTLAQSEAAAHAEAAQPDDANSEFHQSEVGQPDAARSGGAQAEAVRAEGGQVEVISVAATSGEPASADGVQSDIAEVAASGGAPAEAARAGGTGDDRVDAALRRLDAIEELPVSEHVAQYDAVHRTLQDALATIDEG